MTSHLEEKIDHLQISTSQLTNEKDCGEIHPIFAVPDTDQVKSFGFFMTLTIKRYFFV